MRSTGSKRLHSTAGIGTFKQTLSDLAVALAKNTARLLEDTPDKAAALESALAMALGTVGAVRVGRPPARRRRYCGQCRPPARRRRCCDGCPHADSLRGSKSALDSVLGTMGAGDVQGRTSDGHLHVDAATAAAALKLTKADSLCGSKSALVIILDTVQGRANAGHLHPDAAAAAAAWTLTHFARASQL